MSAPSKLIHPHIFQALAEFPKICWKWALLLVQVSGLKAGWELPSVSWNLRGNMFIAVFFQQLDKAETGRARCSKVSAIKKTLVRLPNCHSVGCVLMEPVWFPSHPNWVFPQPETPPLHIIRAALVNLIKTAFPILSVLSYTETYNAISLQRHQWSSF